MVGGVLVKRLELHLKESFNLDMVKILIIKHISFYKFPTLSCSLYLLYCRVQKFWFRCNLLHLLSEAVLDLHENLADEDHVLADVVDVVGVGKDEVDVKLPSLFLPRQLNFHSRLQEALLPPLQHCDTVL